MKAINKALVQFHTALKPIHKDAVNPFFKSDYLTLSGILDAVREPLAKNGLAIAQPIRVDGERNILITRLIHESGEEMVSEMILPGHSDPQKLGSLVTYYKRYQLQALLGISASDEDDDGNAVSQPQRKDVRPDFDQPRPGNEFPASEKQIKMIQDLCIKLGKEVPAINHGKHASDIIARLMQLEQEAKKTPAKNTFKV